MIVGQLASAKNDRIIFNGIFDGTVAALHDRIKNIHQAHIAQTRFQIDIVFLTDILCILHHAHELVGARATAHAAAHRTAAAHAAAHGTEHHARSDARHTGHRVNIGIVGVETVQTGSLLINTVADDEIDTHVIGVVSEGDFLELLSYCAQGDAGEPQLGNRDAVELIQNLLASHPGVDQVGACHNIGNRQILCIGGQNPCAGDVHDAGIGDQASLAHNIGGVLLLQKFLIVLSGGIIRGDLDHRLENLLRLLIGAHFVEHLGVVKHLIHFSRLSGHIFTVLTNFLAGDAILHQRALFDCRLPGALSLQTRRVHPQSIIQLFNGQIIITLLQGLLSLVDAHFGNTGRNAAIFLGRTGLAHLAQGLVSIAVQAGCFSPIACGASFVGLIQIGVYLFNSLLASYSFFFSDLRGGFDNRCVLRLDSYLRPESHQESSTEEEASPDQHGFSVLVNFHTTSFTVQHYISK